MAIAPIPKTQKTAQRAVFCVLGYFMGRPGFEPGTNRLKAEYSTVELATHLSCGCKLLFLSEI